MITIATALPDPDTPRPFPDIPASPHSFTGSDFHLSVRFMFVFEVTARAVGIIWCGSALGLWSHFAFTAIEHRCAFNRLECDNVPSLQIAIIGCRIVAHPTSMSLGDVTDHSMSPNDSGTFSMSPPTTPEILRDSWGAAAAGPARGPARRRRLPNCPSFPQRSQYYTPIKDHFWTPIDTFTVHPSTIYRCLDEK